MDAIKVHGLDSITILDHYRMGRLSNILDGIKNKLNKKKKYSPHHKRTVFFGQKPRKVAGGRRGVGMLSERLQCAVFHCQIYWFFMHGNNFITMLRSAMLYMLSRESIYIAIDHRYSHFTTTSHFNLFMLYFWQFVSRLYQNAARHDAEYSSNFWSFNFLLIDF